MRAHTDLGARNARRCRSQRGFSLIELLVVVVVLGIVAGVSTLVVSGIVATGRTMACDSDRRIMA